jgi:hypothetical protein
VADRPAGVALTVEVAVAVAGAARGEAVALVAAEQRLGAVLGGVRPCVVVGAAVVLVEPVLLLGRELAVGRDVGRVLDEVLLVLHADVIAMGGGVADRDEAHVGPEQPRLDGEPLGVTAVAVEVDVLDGADFVAVAVV